MNAAEIIHQLVDQPYPTEPAVKAGGNSEIEQGVLARESADYVLMHACNGNARYSRALFGIWVGRYDRSRD